MPHQTKKTPQIAKRPAKPTPTKPKATDADLEDAIKAKKRAQNKASYEKHKRQVAEETVTIINRNCEHLQGQVTALKTDLRVKSDRANAAEESLKSLRESQDAFETKVNQEIADRDNRIAELEHRVTAADKAIEHWRGRANDLEGQLCRQEETHAIQKQGDAARIKDAEAEERAVRDQLAKAKSLLQASEQTIRDLKWDKDRLKGELREAEAAQTGALRAIEKLGKGLGK